MARNYAAEYARRKALEETRARAENRAPSLHRARGHGSREREALERRLRKTVEQNKPKVDTDGNVVVRGYQHGSRPSTKGLISEHGVEKLNRNLDLRDQAAEAYSSGHTDQAHLLWMRIDPGMPEWLFWYHGVFG